MLMGPDGGHNLTRPTRRGTPARLSATYDQPVTRVPFRLGATSFVYPDRWLANVERLVERNDRDASPMIRDVEILLFDIDDDIPDEAEIRGLVAIAKSAGLTYTVHTPLGASLASEDEARRQASVAQVGRAIDIASPLQPHAYIVHVYLGDREHDRPGARLDAAAAKAWRGRAARSLEALLQHGCAPADLCVETLDYDFAIIAPVVRDLGLSVALDLGHVERDGRSAPELLEEHLGHTKVIQWHGVVPGGRDHGSLRHYPRAQARRVIDTLLAARYAGVLTLEVFGQSDLAESLTLVESLLREARA